MFQTAGYPTHPTAYFSSPYEFHTPPPTRSPPFDGGGKYYSPRQYVHTQTPLKGHNRRATGDGTYNFTSNNAYTTPQPKTTYYSGQDRTPAGKYGSAHTTPLRATDHVSGSERKRDGVHHSRTPAGGTGRTSQKYSTSKQHSSRSHFVHDDQGDREYECLPRYEQYEARPPPYNRAHQGYHYESRADQYFHDQMPTFAAEDTPQHRPRPRRSSHSAKTARDAPPPRRPATATKPPPKATEADARRHGIPAGYSFKNWDPTEEPILLLGSVFDANSLGRWIYDWTVFLYGSATPFSDLAGDLWLSLIQLAGKIKRAEESMNRVRQAKSRELFEDFLESGERLWQRFNKLLKICENYMWKAAKKESGKGAKVTMGTHSGCEFVESIFGRDRELERTEKLMASIRLWSMRFDANCEDILRNPAA